MIQNNIAMENYYIRLADATDLDDITVVYNSNPIFLLQHLGKNRIEGEFVKEDMQEMKRAGFCSCIIINREDGKVVGVLDYGFVKQKKEAYLSILVLHHDLQKKGIGRDIYLSFERMMSSQGVQIIRIDVVKDYEGNAVPFWKKVGFSESEVTELVWGQKKSQAVIMKKRIG